MAVENRREFGLDSRLLDQGGGLRDSGGEGTISSVSPSRNASNNARSPRPRRKVTFVYFIESEGRIKIGITQNVKARISSLRTTVKDLKLIAVIRADKHVESALHRKLHVYHIYGEWFEDCAEVRAAIINSLNNFPVEPMGEHAKGGPPLKWVGVARLLWPKKTAAHLAAITGKDARTGTRYLTEGQSEPPGAVIAAIVAELFKREGE